MSVDGINPRLNQHDDVEPSRRWFVTGASRGLGRAIVEAALRRGDRVVATARAAQSLSDLQEQYRAALEVEVLDVTDIGETDAVIAGALSRGPIDIVVNNAGYSLTGAAEEMTDEEMQHQIETLLLAPMRITRRFLGPMRRNGGGRIIQISSVGGQVVYPAASAYHAGKWGLEGFTEAVASEVAEYGVRCTIVEPGSTRTDFPSSMRYTQVSAAYQRGAVADMRAYIRSADDKVYTEDPHKLADVIVELTRNDEPPLRLPLGADAHAGVTQALRERLAAITPLADVAASVAFTR